MGSIHLFTAWSSFLLKRSAFLSTVSLSESSYMYLTTKDRIHILFQCIASCSRTNKSHMHFWCLWANPWKKARIFHRQNFSLCKSGNVWKAELLFFSQDIWKVWKLWIICVKLSFAVSSEDRWALLAEG